MRSSKSASLGARITALVAFTLGVGPAAQAFDPGLSGSLRSAYFSRDKSLTGIDHYWVPSAWLSLRPAEIEGFKGFLEAYAQADDLSRTADVRSELREAYLERSIEAFDFRVGRQIIVWGRADKINPTDYLSTKNLRASLVDDEEARLGAAGLQAIRNFGSFRLIAVWQPEWRSPRFPIPAVPGVRITQGDPSGRAGQVALKLDQSGGAIDWSVSAFNGLSRVPDLGLIAAGPTGVDLSLDYPNIQALGGDLAFNAGELGLRAEASVTRTGDTAGEDPLRQNPFLYAVAGVDRSFFEDLSVNGQVLYRHVFAFRDASAFGPAPAALADQLNLISNQQRENQFGLTVRSSLRAYHETLEAELAYVAWFGNPSSLIRPKLTYAFSDHVKGLIGAEIYRGRPDTFFGRLSQASAVFAEGRLLF